MSATKLFNSIYQALECPGYVFTKMMISSMDPLEVDPGFELRGVYWTDRGKKNQYLRPIINVFFPFISENICVYHVFYNLK